MKLPVAYQAVTGLTRPGCEPLTDPHGHCNETAGGISRWCFLYQPLDCCLVNNNAVDYSQLLVQIRYYCRHTDGGAYSNKL